VSRAERLIVVATCLVLVAAGVVLATIEAFLVPVRLFGGTEGLAVLLAVLGNLAIGLLAAAGLDSSAGAAAPALGWFAAASIATFSSPHGSVVVPGTLGNDPGVPVVGVVWYFGGVLSSGIAVFVSSVRARSRLQALHQTGEHAEAC
jgi:hypothetical protein